jgi:glycopeptide antibiotics resistance protein
LARYFLLTSGSTQELSRIFLRLSGFHWTGFFRDKLFNIVMFLPFGVLLGMIAQSGAKPERTLLKTAVLAAFFSLVIETLQYFLPERHPAASDLLMNTFGSFLGAWLVSRGLAVVPLKLSRSS